MARGVLSYEKFDAVIARAISPECSTTDLTARLFILNCLILNISQGKSLENSKLKVIEDVRKLPVSYRNILKQMNVIPI